jgi:hypothetical protein
MSLLSSHSQHGLSIVFISEKKDFENKKLIYFLIFISIIAGGMYLWLGLMLSYVYLLKTIAIKLNFKIQKYVISKNKTILYSCGVIVLFFLFYGLDSFISNLPIVEFHFFSAEFLYGNILLAIVISSVFIIFAGHLVYFLTILPILLLQLTIRFLNFSLKNENFTFIVAIVTLVSCITALYSKFSSLSEGENFIVKIGQYCGEAVSFFDSLIT